MISNSVAIIVTNNFVTIVTDGPCSRPRDQYFFNLFATKARNLKSGWGYIKMYAGVPLAPRVYHQNNFWKGFIAQHCLLGMLEIMKMHHTVRKFLGHFKVTYQKVLFFLVWIYNSGLGSYGLRFTSSKLIMITWQLDNKELYGGTYSSWEEVVFCVVFKVQYCSLSNRQLHVQSQQ